MSNAIARVHYFDRQYLRLDEFVDEQAYHLATHRRHNLSHHTWGILYGLRLLTDEAGRPYLEPGVAVDGYGRDVILDTPRPIPVAAFEELQSEEIAVSVVYDRIGSERLPASWEPCGKERSSSGFYREQELARVRTEVPDPDAFDPRRPESVPEGDLDFAPWRDSPDSVRDDWPVFVGRVVRDANDPAAPTYIVDLKDRPYAGARAASIAAPFDPERPRILLGGDHLSGTAAFEVRVPGPGTTARTALDIQNSGNMTSHGHLSIRGDLGIEGGVLDFGIVRPEGLLPSKSPAEGDEVAQPWRIYRHRQPEAEAAGFAEEPEAFVAAQEVGEQLRIEMGPDGAEVVIGLYSEDDDAFKPCLTIDSNCTVTVHGNLVVEGSISGLIAEAKKRIVPGLSTEAKNFALANFTAGVGGSSLFLVGGSSVLSFAGVLPQFFETSPFGTGVVPIVAAAPAMAATLADDDAGLAAFAETLRGTVAGSKLARLLDPENHSEIDFEDDTGGGK